MVGTVTKTHCERGHSRTSENVFPSGACRECAVAQARAWQVAHPEKYLANCRAWQASHPESRAYLDAKGRCTNPNDKFWKDYGGRGIEFRFESFEQFFAELGPRPAGMTLDRLDNDGHYAPGNVRWATRKEQQANRRGQKFGSNHKTKKEN